MLSGTVGTWDFSLQFYATVFHSDLILGLWKLHETWVGVKKIKIYPVGA